MDGEVLDVTTLTCGCVLTRTLVDGGPILTIAPCRTDCPSLAAALDIADELDKPVVFREAP